MTNAAKAVKYVYPAVELVLILIISRQIFARSPVVRLEKVVLVLNLVDVFVTMKRLVIYATSRARPLSLGLYYNVTKQQAYYSLLLNLQPMV